LRKASADSADDGGASMMEIAGRLIRLINNRTYRGYPGGRELMKFRGEPYPVDDQCPEAWVGSTTLTHDHALHPGGRLGHAQAWLDNGGTAYLKDLVDADPEGLLGKRHVDRFGPDEAVLVKLLDAERQLGLQCHPDRAFAKSHFHSDYGKVECWYVLGVRDDSPETPYLLLGFKEGITREAFEELYKAGDIAAMEKWCHRIPAKVGDMFHVGAGVPHAIGPGCLVVEVQEPSDITVGARPRHIGDPEADRAFDERTLGSFHYDGRSRDENLKAGLIPPIVLRAGPEGSESLLIGTARTPCFGATRLQVAEHLSQRDTGTFSIAIVVGGAGSLQYDGGLIPVRQGDELFLPAGLKDAVWTTDTACKALSGTNDSKPFLEVVCCYPPEAV
jgi:mannose-6-phosphate isomerase